MLQAKAQNVPHQERETLRTSQWTQLLTPAWVLIGIFEGRLFQFQESCTHSRILNLVVGTIRPSRLFVARFLSCVRCLCCPPPAWFQCVFVSLCASPLARSCYSDLVPNPGSGVRDLMVVCPA